jgi:arylsulfatase A-like enzyme
VLSVKEIIAIDEKYQKRLESLQAVDDLVKELITTLKSIGALENTYIFFTSDNGFHLGQHRMLPGKRTAYEEDIHLPLIVRGPGVVPGTINELVGNIDFVSTFSDLAGGLSIPYEPDGRSFAGLLSPLFAKPTTWRQGYLIGFELQDLIATGSFEAANWVGRRDDPHTKKIQKNTADQSIDNEENLAGEDILKLGYAGVRTDRYIYIEYGNSDKEFYDLENDPYELQNIYTSADPKLIREHQQMLNALRTCSGLSCKTAEEMPNSFSND